MVPLVLLLGGGACNRAGEQRMEEHEKIHSGARVVFKNAAGRELKFDDLKSGEGDLEWEVRGGKPIQTSAKELHERARQAGSKGDYQAAIELLDEAAKLAPDWPYPVYDRAFTYLLVGKPERALKDYEKVDLMEPRGFFTAKTAIWALRKELTGEIATGTYKAYLAIEWTKDKAEKLSRSRAIVESVPDYAPAWKEIAWSSESPQEKLAAIERGLSANPDAETLGILVVNKASLLNGQGKKPDAIKMLGELILDPSSTRSAVTLAKSALSLILD